MVGDDGEVVAAEDLLRFCQVTHRAGERLLGIEACIDLPTLGAKSISFCLVAATNRLVQEVSEPTARLEIDRHAEKVSSRSQRGSG